jgi:hypothetical protein
MSHTDGCKPKVCGSQRDAAEFALKFLAAQVRDAERMAKAITLRSEDLNLLSSLVRPLKSPWRGILAQKLPMVASPCGICAIIDPPE